MNWGLSYIQQIETTAEKQLTATSIDVLDTFLSLMRVILPRVQLRLKEPNRLLVQFSGMIIALLKLINKGKLKDFFEKFNT